MASLNDAQRRLLEESLAKHGLDRASSDDGDDLFEPTRKSDPRPAERPLTPREIEVLTLVAEGWTNSRIARELFLAEETVKSHVRKILVASDARNRAHAIAKALRSGVIE